MSFRRKNCKNAHKAVPLLTELEPLFAMSKALDYVLQVESEWAKAIEIRNRLQREVQALREENTRLKTCLARRATAHKALVDKNKNLTTVNTLLGGDPINNKSVKARMNHLIREVGACIAQLKITDERQPQD